MGKALENSGGDIECKFNVLLLQFYSLPFFPSSFSFTPPIPPTLIPRIVTLFLVCQSLMFMARLHRGRRVCQAICNLYHGRVSRYLT